ncbi:MAG: NAD(P)-dependent oxidoreductase [Verrucomicrobia bacterium]|nr:NAD(P)-dependent oxidoreductase [Verrucomicrobiota bacterium]
MKILITGAAGYQAGFVIDRLQARHELTFFDRVEPRAPGRFIGGDITRFDDVKAACAGQDAVVHLVALVRDRFDKPQDLFADIMVKGTWNVAEACARQGVRKLVNISSIVAPGWPDDPDRLFRVGDPANFGGQDMFYCLAKHLGEEIGRAYHAGRGLAVINLRPGIIAGDGLNPDPKRPDDDPGANWFLYVHPEDVAQAVERAIESDAVTSGTFQVVAGHPQARYDWQATKAALGYEPQHNWEAI